MSQMFCNISSYQMESNNSQMFIDDFPTWFFMQFHKFFVKSLLDCLLFSKSKSKSESKVGGCSRGGPKSSLFNWHNTEV